MKEVNDHEFDIDGIRLTKKLIKVEQRGNYLVCTTDTGITFRQSIPAGKLLTKKEGQYTLIDREVR